MIDFTGVCKCNTALEQYNIDNIYCINDAQDAIQSQDHKWYYYILHVHTHTHVSMS